MEKKRSSFSIIIPTHGTRTAERAIRSACSQCYPRELIEVIAVEDGNAKIYDGMAVDKVIHHNASLERAISRTEGMEEATGDWIIWLDSDDELFSSTLYLLDYYIRKFPEFAIFHYGGVVYFEPNDWCEEDYSPRTEIRPTPDLPDGSPGMGFFPTGLVASGHFIFRSDLFLELGGLPKESSPYSFADKCVKEFPELKKMMEDRNVDTLGNPWGDDFFYMYKLTRKYKSKGLPLNLYLQHVRR